MTGLKDSKKVASLPWNQMKFARVSYISYIKPATEGEQPLEAASRNRTPTPS
jgi:hypothetical protein